MLQTSDRRKILKGWEELPESHRCKLSWGVRGHAPPEMFENLSLYNGHFQHFQDKFLAHKLLSNDVQR